MQRAFDMAAEELGIAQPGCSEQATLARFVRAAYIIGNRDVQSIAKFSIEAVLLRRRAQNKP
ncbi:hypothetical protein OSJ77_09340 [Phyllobacterium sp. 0TCS1.6C]|nr:MULTISPECIES: hypothetical protein [unclassified Phyllobacterium]MCX8280395.1 hypothetical protein [Phyllobacterium sp. 0TCS1.6C]MCX8295156.1 hypothetical protein [Phyllobacterium sp. 0TCS1.6A]